jgi:hypothetical protein
MGLVNGSDNRHIMQDLFTFLAEQFSIRTFVETGTYQGETALFASRVFPEVVTIEGSDELYAAARKRLQDCPNVACLCGDSRQHLASITGDLLGRVLFWLDAHWSGGITFGRNAECPLLDELQAIYSSPCEPFVVIDDARFFVSLPPEPHDIRDWPSYFDVAAAVQDRAPGTFTTLYADAIVLAPKWAAEALIPFLRRPLPGPRSRMRSWLPWWNRRASA